MYPELNTILSWFQTGDYPTQDQFQQSWSSFWHKYDKLPMSSIINLESSLQNKVDKSIYNAHLTSSDAHSTTLAKLDGSNLNYLNVQVWKDVLGVGELPSNIALIDDPANSLQGNVWTKSQSNALYLLLADFVVSGKIRADKIEALGLTELISVTETSLSAFITNNANYQFEKNDFIAIPNGSGNFNLYIYKGGSKTVSTNYLPTGLTNITIAMVEGLQNALDSKLDKPSGNGSFFVNRNGTVSSYRIINPSSNYLLFWNGTDFTSSDIYNIAGKYGIGTTSPTEAFHINNGRIRSKAMVLDENNETLINQITTYNRKLLFTDSTGTKKTILTIEDLPTEFMALPSKLSDTQKTTWKTEMNGGWSTGTISVGSILPAVTPYQDAPTWVTLRGANLNLNPANFSITVLSNVGVILATIPNSQINLINGTELSFYYNFYALGVGNYKFRLANGIATYDTGFSLKIADNIIQVPIGSINWGEKSYNDFDSPIQSAIGGNVHFKVDANQKPIADENVTVYKVKALDSLVFENSDNFYVEMNLAYNALFGQSPVGVSVILANNADLNLNDDSLVVLKLRGYGGASGVLDVFGVIKADYANNTNLNLRITKQGDQVTIGYKITQTGFNVTEGVAVTSIVNTSDLHLGFAFGNKNNSTAECNINLITAYKF